MPGVASELAVRGGALAGASPRDLHPLVRLPEQAQPENADGHDQQRGRHEGDEQLGVDLRRHAADGPDERVVARAQGAPLGGVRPASPAGASGAPRSAQGLNSAVPPTMLVISQRPSIRATSRSPAVTSTTSPVFTSTKWHSKCSVPRSPLTVTRSLYAGWSTTHSVAGLKASDFSQNCWICCFPGRRLSGTDGERRVLRPQAHHLVDVLLRKGLVEVSLDLADQEPVDLFLQLAAHGARASARRERDGEDCDRHRAGRESASEPQSAQHSASFVQPA